MDQSKEVQVQVKAADEELKGRYANAIQISRPTAEEFLLDFLLIAPPGGQLLSRIVMSPGHVKRLAAAINQQLGQYEHEFGEVEEAQAPKQPGIGFKTE